MIFETIESEGLAQLSYLIGDADAGVCVVIDPRRDVDVYLERARHHGVRVLHALETHIHADFVSGSRELAARTGCTILTGESDEYGFDGVTLGDGETVQVGDLRLRALHTPGHSPEHLSYAVGDANADDPWGVFTGDALFAGSVGRPDLAAGHTAEHLARMLHRSIREVLLPLGDDVLVFPGHGVGSPCGADIGEREVTTIGHERRHNEILRIDEADDFVEAVLEELPEEPAYYSRMKKLNAEGATVTGGMPHLQALDPERFEDTARGEDTIVVDTREIEAYSGGHIEDALSLALRPSFPVWAGRMLEPERRICLVTARHEDVATVQRHLFRIGLDEIAGYLGGGMRAWFEAARPVQHRHDLSVHELRRHLDDGDELQVLDVRSDGEWSRGRIPGAVHAFVPELANGARERLDPERPVATYCGSGYRASIAASLLARQGFDNVHNVPGSMRAWQAAGYPVEGA